MKHFNIFWTIVSSLAFVVCIFCAATCIGSGGLSFMWLFGAAVAMFVLWNVRK